MKTWYIMGAGGVLGVIAALAIVTGHHHPSTQSPNGTVAAATNVSNQTNANTSNTTNPANNTQGSSTNSNGNTTSNSTQGTGNTASSGTSSGANTTQSSTTNSSQVQQVMATVQQMLQQTPPKSMDASGFVQYVYAQAGVQLPRTIAEQAKVGTTVTNRANLQPGDLVFFNLDSSSSSTSGGGSSANNTSTSSGSNATPTFDGVYIGNNQFAALTTHGLMSISLSNSYWSGKFLYGQRVS